MLKFLFYLPAFIFLFNSGDLESGLIDHQATYGEELTSRFIRLSDSQMDDVVNVPLRDSWWSRPHEYAWASKFADQEVVALDAACGISHPFKWLLGETCKAAWACDADPRIDNMATVIQETYDDLGEIAYEVLVNTPRLYNQVNLVRASICKLPDEMPQFERIFCISTLEHLCEKDQKDAMSEFARFLAPNGLLVITVDYPEVSPEALIALADSVGLVPAGKVSLKRPVEDVLTNGYLSIYRCVFAHREEN